MNEFYELLTDSCQKHMNENLERVRKCLDVLESEMLWHKPNDSINSVGNLILHLNGNITQYVHSGLGGEPDKRMRDLEFDPTHQPAKETLWQDHRRVIHKANRIIEDLIESDLHGRKMVQGFDLNGMDILIHVTEHYSYHTGQIAYLVKHIHDVDLGFYSGQDLNVRNENS